MMNKEQVREKIDELTILRDICVKFGEVDGATAANAQVRALQKELAHLEAE